MAKLILLSTGISGALAVMLGAFGAHGLKSRLAENLLTVYQTGIQYHFYHTLALGFVALALYRWPGSTLLSVAGWSFIIGILLFSGSLYLLAVTGIKWLGAVTPIGGVAFIIGWACISWFAARNV
ncbi:DUF423 domain-containing protein [Endozoicomonas sp. SM1973]|uniref:DUF423 domain-containing protein n=1 Tax=Spartinivicinus marinus TaxID=2994442 RepID=A0A853HRI3_9GAMM|nr:DUF423 domain-containing protein [Spartinivicinus marinus]MCX4026573.1 DUF423 domain-containing protein [Spartinivicinus marinus]NYZ64410.1 DUF423 domain-containing protein [Spartinivicinus marinus]